MTMSRQSAEDFLGSETTLDMTVVDTRHSTFVKPIGCATPSVNFKDLGR